VQEVRLAVSLACLVFGCAHGDEPRPSVPPRAERAAPEAAAVPSGWGRYVVRRGDTLSRIARCRGVSAEALAQVNELPDPDQLSAGSSLHVPSRDRCASETAAASARPADRKPAANAPPPVSAAAPQPSAAPVAPAPTPEASARAVEARARGERLLQQATEAYDAADFERALARAGEAAERLGAAPRGADTAALSARCHLVAAMAAVGLDQRERAVGELRQTFALDPQLTLDPETSSPRILELAEEARSGSSSGKPIVERGAVSSAP
jgi:LysM repeat protein